MSHTLQSQRGTDRKSLITKKLSKKDDLRAVEVKGKAQQEETRALDLQWHQATVHGKGKEENERV